MVLKVSSSFLLYQHTLLSHPVLRPNRMLIVCVPRDKVYIPYHTENGYKITNVAI
jgi:hypothetical protein